jgi:MFS family permease
MTLIQFDKYRLNIIRNSEYYKYLVNQIQKNSIKYSYLEALITSFVVGLAENFFAAYAVQSGLSALQSGLLVSVPLIFAGVIQFISLPYFQFLSVSKFVQIAVLLQSVVLMILSSTSLINTKPSFFILLFLYSIYWLGHFAIQPAWNRWIAEIVPAEFGQNYFSYRNRISQSGIIAGLILGGMTLHMKVIDVSIEKLYFSLFAFGFLCKLGSFYLFTKHDTTNSTIYLSRQKMFLIFKKYQKFLRSYSLFNFSIYLSAPFVVGYLLKERNLNYFDFMLVMLGLFVGKILTSMWLQKSKKQIDPTRLMFIGGLIAAPLPVLWPLCSDVWMMILVHTVSGMAWVGWEVGLSLCFFKNIMDSEKIETISLYHYIGTLTQVLGTCIGALMINFAFHQNYNFIFILAGVVRLICVLPLRKNKLSVELQHP